MTAERAGASSRAFSKPLVWLWLALTVLLILVCAARTSSTVMDDDNLWLAYLSIPPTAEAKTIERQLIARTAQDEPCSEVTFRLSLRDHYGANYAGYVGLNTLVYRAMAGVEGQGAGVAIRALIAAKVLAFIAVAALLIGFGSQLRDRRLNLAIAAALTAMVALDWVIHTGAVPVVWIADVGDPIKAATRLAYSFMFASEAHSLFGLTPRNVALGLFAVAMVLRWNRLPLAAAMAILLTGVVHQTYGGMAFVMFVAATAVSRPEALNPWPVRLVLTLSLVMFLIRDGVLSMGVVPQLATAAVLAVAALAGFAFIQSRGYVRLRGQLLGRFGGEEVVIDGLVMALLSLLITAAAMAFAGNSAPSMRLYFWSDLAFRIWSFARFPMFVAAVFVLLRWLPIGRPAVPIGLMAATVLLSALTVLQIDRTPEWAGPRPLDGTLAAVERPVLELPSDEAALYAHLTGVSAGAEPAAFLAQRLSTMRIRCSALPI